MATQAAARASSGESTGQSWSCVRRNDQTSSSPGAGLSRRGHVMAGRAPGEAPRVRPRRPRPCTLGCPSIDIAGESACDRKRPPMARVTSAAESGVARRQKHRLFMPEGLACVHCSTPQIAGVRPHVAGDSIDAGVEKAPRPCAHPVVHGQCCFNDKLACRIRRYQGSASNSAFENRMPPREASGRPRRLGGVAVIPYPRVVPLEGKTAIPLGRLGRPGRPGARRACRRAGHGAAGCPSSGRRGRAAASTLALSHPPQSHPPVRSIDPVGVAISAKVGCGLRGGTVACRCGPPPAFMPGPQATRLPMATWHRLLGRAYAATPRQ